MPTLLFRGLGAARTLLTWGLVPGVVILPADLAEALLAHLEADAALLARLPGGIWGDEAPADTPLPYAVLVEVAEVAEYEGPKGSGRVPYADRAAIQVGIFDSSRSAARGLGNLVEAAVNDAPLEFEGGDLLWLRRSDRRMQKDPELGPGGVDVWQRILVFDALTQRQL